MSDFEAYRLRKIRLGELESLYIVARNLIQSFKTKDVKILADCMVELSRQCERVERCVKPDISEKPN